MPQSPVQRAKRAFVSVLLTLATAYGLHVDVTRESGDETVQAAYRKVSRSVHPDKGGCDEDAQRLNTARDAWQDARRAGQPAGRPLRRPAAATPLHASALTESRRTCRVNATAVLLTYQSWPSGSGTATWEAFCRFVSEHVRGVGRKALGRDDGGQRSRKPPLAPDAAIQHDCGRPRQPLHL